MEQKTNYGKIIAITLAVISAASAIAYVIYRLVRNLLTFCASYDEDDDAESLDFDELDEDFDSEEILDFADDAAEEALAD